MPDVIFFLYLSIVFCLGFPILPYALSFYWHFVLRPLHFILLGVPPPFWQQPGVIMMKDFRFNHSIIPISVVSLLRFIFLDSGHKRGKKQVSLHNDRPELRSLLVPSGKRSLAMSVWIRGVNRSDWDIMWVSWNTIYDYDIFILHHITSWWNHFIYIYICIYICIYTYMYFLSFFLGDLKLSCSPTWHLEFRCNLTWAFACLWGTDLAINKNKKT